MADAGVLPALAEADEPGRDCPLCPRLVGYREANRAAFPGWHNAPVAGFGARSASLLIVGLAPGVRGANRTGRPFTGDFAGVLLYGTLLAVGLAEGAYGADPADGLVLRDCRIVNAVRCVPPANLPTPVEARTCNPFLAAEMAAMKRLRGVLALGVVAHAAVLRAAGVRPASAAFRHGAMHDLPGGRVLADSYHVSRLNTNTGRLTAAMFAEVVAALLRRAGQE
ncbi:MAG TPA: uracil-DNA glycosylase [Acetobacteraceae bacterium]|jgi:uracil-DNA glycosylase family 4|nr:uracil-DNA glycosylase [Acetobacteraceae bacterium]